MQKYKKPLLILAVSVLPLAAFSDPAACIDCTIPPFTQVGATWGDQFGFLGEGKWVNYFTPTNPFGFEVDFGEAEFRIGGTLTHIITDQQRFKITAEHFAQHFDINFFQNDDRQWIGENDVAATYEYLFHTYYLKNIYASMYFTDAESEDVGIQNFTTPFGQFSDIQRFVGGKLKGLNGGFTASPWFNARTKFDLYYDNVTYNTHFVESKSRAGLGAGVEYQQLFSDHLRTVLSASIRQPFSQYQAGIYYLFNTRPGTRFEVGLNASHLTGDIFTGSDNRATVGFTYSWNGDPNCPPASYYNDVFDNVLLWTAQPAIAMPAVLLQKDERIVSN